jgi:AcrR family transcriptional regulator
MADGTARRSPRQKRSRATVDRILGEAARLFDELEYAGTTTNKIAEAAGISIGTLYHYFPNKDSILHALAERHLAEATDSLVSVFARLRREQPPLETSVRSVVDAVAQLHVAEPRLPALLYDQAPRSADSVRQLRAAEAAMADEVAWHLERLGVVCGEPRRVAHLLVTGIEAQIHRAVFDPVAGEALDASVDLITALWVRALGGR